MPTYRLVPIPDRLNHRDWAYSIYQDVCRASAENERAARQMVTWAFGIAAKRDGGTTGLPPWQQPELTECSADYNEPPLPLGKMAIPGRSEPFSVEDAWKEF